MLRDNLEWTTNVVRQALACGGANEAGGSGAEPLILNWHLTQPLGVALKRLLSDFI